MLCRLACLFPLLCAFILLASCSAPAEEEEWLGFLLLDPGAEPRTPLRYDLAAFSPTGMTMRMETESVVHSDDLPDGAMTTNMPVFVLTMDTKDHVLDDQGHLTLVTVMTSFRAEDREGVDPAVTQLMEEMLGQMSGLRATLTMDDRGQLLSHSVNFGDMDPMLKEQMSEILNLVEDMVHGFPEEPVGIGARWEERDVLTVEGMEVSSRAVYTLVDRTENEVKLDMDLEQTGRLQPSPDLPEALLSTTGSGLVTVRLDSHAQTGTMRMQTKSTMHGLGDSPVEVTVTMKMTFDSVPGADP